MLQNSPLYAYIPAQDVSRARRFSPSAAFSPAAAPGRRGSRTARATSSR